MPDSLLPHLALSAAMVAGLAGLPGARHRRRGEGGRGRFQASTAVRIFPQHRAMPRFNANADYEEKDTNPIRLQPGDEVTVGPVDRAWPGWVWAEDDSDNDGYVPEGILEPLGEGRYAAIEAFDPTTLVVRRGDELESLKQIHGWHWCRNAKGEEGWVAGYLLRPAT